MKVFTVDNSETIRTQVSKALNEAKELGFRAWLSKGFKECLFISSILMFVGPGIILGLSLLGSVGLSQAGLSKELREIPSIQLNETYKHTREVCYVYILTSKETYCKLLKD